MTTRHPWTAAAAADFWRAVGRDRMGAAIAEHGLDHVGALADAEHRIRVAVERVSAHAYLGPATAGIRAGIADALTAHHRPPHREDIMAEPAKRLEYGVALDGSTEPHPDYVADTPEEAMGLARRRGGPKHLVAREVTVSPWQPLLPAQHGATERAGNPA